MRYAHMTMGTTKALRAACGNLAARRGSTLILVVATLALLAVLTVAYVSIGGGDRRSARTTTRAAEVERQAQHIADYLVGIVGDDALSVYFEGYDRAGQPIFVTEAVDLPRTDPNRTFDGQVPSGPATPEPQENYYGLAFTPTGSLPPLRSSDDATRPATDLFEFGNPQELLPFGPSDPFLAASEPTFIRPAGDPFMTPSYLDRIDWPKISNVSPNGLFVNLFNVRGNFDAEPGIGQDSLGRDRTSENLFVYDGSGSPGTTLEYDGTTANPAIPAHFDSVQLRSFQPIDFVPSGVGIMNPEFPSYMWADADGDGYFDSRWQELVDVTVPGASGTFIPRKVIPSEGQLRWFVASRIIDLSGKVNVNTARGIMQPVAGGGFDGEPTNADRLGVTPADIELRRVLTLENSWAMFGEFYDMAPQPSGGAQDYSDYSDFAVARAVGDQGYWALRQVLTGEQPPAGPLMFGVPPQLPDERRTEYLQLRQGGDAAQRTTATGVYRQYGFGLEDLSDLLTFNGLNNPSSLTSLERAVGGREMSEPSFSPLRENRSLQWERDLTDPDAALALRHIGIRQHLTTLSGGIPRVPTRIDYTQASPTVLTAFDVFTSLSALPQNTIASGPNAANPSMLQNGYDLLRLAAPSDLPIGGGSAEANARLLRNAHPLFRTYANALMPSAGEAGAWDPANIPWLTTFYGSDRLFALRTAAHLTANMIDAFDGDDVPSAFTVLAAFDARSDVLANPIEFPWWSEPDPANPGSIGVSGQIDFGDQRLPSTSESGGVWAMNVYGLEVHPFITQVSLYNVFTDAWSGGGGDMEWPMGGGGGPGPIFGPGPGAAAITIDFDTSSANEDFIGQVFAVQLTNPYTTNIMVRPNQYFVRFGELDDTLPGGGGLEVPAGLVIPAGRSVVAYIESQGFSTKAVDAAPDFASVGNGDVQSWLNLHFSTDPILTPAVRLTADLTGIGDFLAGATGEDLDANREVTLWTRLRGSTSTHDVMLDRMYDPAVTDRPTLDRRPPGVELTVASTTAGDDTTGSRTIADDNTGYSLLTWATIARPTGSAAAPLGALPAYVLEKPFGDGLSPSLNEAATDDLVLPPATGGPFSLTMADFTAGTPELHVTLVDLLQSTGGSGAGGQAETDILLQAHPDPLQMPAPPPHAVRRIIMTSDQTDGLDFDDLYVNPLRNDNRGLLDVATGDPVPMLRPGDFLGVPAVGPVQMPISDGSTVPDPSVLEWFTTGELLTMALGYDEAIPAGTAGSYPSLPEDTYAVLDRGHLSLDRAAPFVDFTNSPTTYDPGDERRGMGVPHAMALLSSITTLDVPLNGRTRVSGLVNLNTATETVTSVLPGLTPTSESTFDPSLAYIREGGIPRHDHRSDVAAGVRSYRDKSAAQTRIPGTQVPFFDTGSAWGDMDPTDLFGRQFTTMVAGLREHPGFLSIGELLAANVPPTPGGGGVGGASYEQPHMIRRLGQDGFSLSVAGVDSVRYDAATGRVDLAAGTVDDGILDDYDEQLALYNGVANTVSVRSDVYAIWFVMHGYAREDVEGLRPDDPMTPSVARRYLIVVDRSNVRRAGDKPRVLLFDELPL